MWILRSSSVLTTFRLEVWNKENVSCTFLYPSNIQSRKVQSWTHVNRPTDLTMSDNGTRSPTKVPLVLHRITVRYFKVSTIKCFISTHKNRQFDFSLPFLFLIPTGFVFLTMRFAVLVVLFLNLASHGSALRGAQTSEETATEVRGVAKR